MGEAAPVDALEALQLRLDRHIEQKGLKFTRQRQVILETFVELGGHAAVDELLSRVQVRMPGVGHATIYRTMKLFTEAGVAHERRFDDGQTRYEPVVVGHDHHDHLICRTCGHIFEFDEPEIERLQCEVAARHGLRIVAHRHDIWGECTLGPTCPHKAG